MTELYMLTEHADHAFMMGFVFLTDAGRAVVIDGGRPGDLQNLLALIGNRPIAAWILTHPHLDHISGFCHLIQNGFDTQRIEKVYYNFPSVEFAEKCEPQFTDRRDFENILPRLGKKAVVVKPGMQVQIDELSVDFLFCGEERYYLPLPNLAINESSLVFRVTAPGMKRVLFLGDLGAKGGADLLKIYGDQLKSEIVQMAHHGHCGVTEAVYQAIAPEACMWCAPDWLYEEEEMEFEPGLWGTKRTRKWMEKLGVKTHYVTKDGTQKIVLFEENI